jgi:hypothetical protein
MAARVSRALAMLSGTPRGLMWRAAFELVRPPSLRLTAFAQTRSNEREVSLYQLFKQNANKTFQRDSLIPREASKWEEAVDRLVQDEPQKHTDSDCRAAKQLGISPPPLSFSCLPLFPSSSRQLLQAALFP